MPGETRFLLVNGSDDHYWRQVFEAALVPLGVLRVGREDEAIELILQQTYDLITVDATVVKDVALLVSRIRAQRPDARVVVVTASPTWTRARDAFQAGAIDYVRKSLDREEILSMVKAALVKILPPWPSR